MSTTTKRLAELKRLAKDAGANLFKRLELCDLVLGDVEWLSATHDGKLDAAEKTLADQYFPDLSSFVSLATCLAVYRRYTDESIWKQHAYQLGAMIAKYEEETSPDQVEERSRTNWRQVAEEEEQLKEEAEQQLSIASKTISDQQLRIEELQSRVRTLESERDRLIGRIEELEKLIPHHQVAH